MLHVVIPYQTSVIPRSIYAVTYRIIAGTSDSHERAALIASFQYCHGTCLGTLHDDLIHMLLFGGLEVVSRLSDSLLS